MTQNNFQQRIPENNNLQYNQNQKMNIPYQQMQNLNNQYENNPNYNNYNINNNINNINNNNNFNPKLDQREEDRREYLINKTKNLGNYSYLTHDMSSNKIQKPFKDMTDEEKIRFAEQQVKEEKMRQYKETLDEQIKNKPLTAYNKENNNIREDVPPDPCKLYFF